MTPRALTVAALALYRREPARANSALATIVVAVALRLGLHPDSGNVLAFIGLVLPYIVASVATRALVVPVVKVRPMLGGKPIASTSLIVDGKTVSTAEYTDRNWQPANPDVHTRSDA